MTKIGILSDTHGFIHPEVITLINQCDFAIHAGDIIDFETLNALQPKQKIIAVKGNNDNHLSHLKAVEILDLPAGKIAIEHGHQHGIHQPCHASLRRTYADAKAIIYGHTHKQIIDQTQTPWIINPGAAGEIRNYGGAKCIVITIDDLQEWQIDAFNFSE